MFFDEYLFRHSYAGIRNSWWNTFQHFRFHKSNCKICFLRSVRKFLYKRFLRIKKLFLDLKNLVKNFDIIHDKKRFWLNEGTFKDQNYINKEISKMTTIMTICGFLGAFVFGFILDRTKKFKLVMILCSAFYAVSYILFMIFYRDGTLL